MSAPPLKEPWNALEGQIQETMQAGYKYPQSSSDWSWCVRALLRMFDVKRLPLPRELPLRDTASADSARKDGG